MLIFAVDFPELHDTDSETDSSTAPNKEKAPIVYLGAFGASLLLMFTVCAISVPIFR